MRSKQGAYNLSLYIYIIGGEMGMCQMSPFILCPGLSMGMIVDQSV